MTPLEVRRDKPRRRRVVDMLVAHANKPGNEAGNLLILAAHTGDPNRYVVELGGGFIYDGKVYIVLPGVIVIYDHAEYCRRGRINRRKGGR
jgi:hypothetical protein